MKILNETCYNTDDLLALYERGKEAIKACSDDATNIFQPNTRLGPSQIQIGYYKPAFAKCRWNDLPNYVNKTGQGDKGIRISIVKPSAFNVAPLMALAAAADGKGLKLPSEALRDLNAEFVSLSTGNWVIAQYPRHWNWLDNFEVRYTARAKRGSRAKVKEARNILRVSKLEASISKKAKQIINKKQSIIYLQRDQIIQQKDLEKLKKSLGL